MITNIASVDTEQSHLSSPNHHSSNILCEDLGRMAQLTQASSSFEAMNADTQPMADSSWKEHHVLLKTERMGGDGASMSSQKFNLMSSCSFIQLTSKRN
jgi:hypothetical protein